MKITIVNLFAIYLTALLPISAYAQTSATDLQVSAPVYAVPPNIISTSSKPMVMLASSKDHTLFGPIYTDYEDIDNDGVIDTTFIPTFKYYGYFDSAKCYNYANNQFEPAQLATINNNKYTCPNDKSYWSGNFLNWATMTRMDVVRKMLYGGKRSTDANQNTVLERANLSRDSHSFVKHYGGTDIRDYTPFSVQNLTKTTGSNKNLYAGLSICNRSSTMGEGGTPNIRLAKGNYKLWATMGGAVCRWQSEFGNGESNTSLRFGNKLARYFSNNTSTGSTITHEIDIPTTSNDQATYSSIGPDLNLRIKSCVAGLIGDEKCQAYPANSSTNFKPIGIFQEFGLGSGVNEAARAEFGVITGSYDSNLNRGALRKNMGDFSEEINQSTGIFCHSNNSGCTNTTGGAIKSFDNFMLYGRGSGDYSGSANQLPSALSNGILPAWGNPMGEMLTQSLNYLAGNTANNPASNTNDNSKSIPTKAWSDPFSKTDSSRLTKYGDPICRPMYNIGFSSSALSFDQDAATDFATLKNRAGDLASYVNKIGDAEKIHGSYRSVGSANGGWGETCAKKQINSLYNVSGICPESPAVGGSYHAAGAALYANTSKIRTIQNPPPDLDKVKDALKVKTMAASLAGGVARIEVAIPNSNPKKYVYITPEGLFDSGNSKTMPAAMLTFQSISSSERHGAFTVTWNDALLGGDYDMDITGFIRYDIINDTKSPSGYSIKIKTDILNTNAGFSGAHGFSIIGTEGENHLEGTIDQNNDGYGDGDGRYLTHRHLGAWSRGHYLNEKVAGYVTSTASATTRKEEKCSSISSGNISGKADTTNKYSHCNVSTGDNTIQDSDYPSEIIFKMKGVNDVILEDPLWYAAKYGNFKSSKIKSDGTYENITLPEKIEDWDSVLTDGSYGSDGVPDGYFLARRPEVLEMQLRRVLEAATSTSNASAPISRPALAEGAFKYTPKFDSASIAGDIEATKLLSNGNFSNDPVWEAGKKLYSQHSYSKGENRQIITNTSSGTGISFNWSSLDTDYKSHLTQESTNKLSETNAQIALSYIRGDTSKEGLTGLRIREKNLLGPIINSTPWLQLRPLATWGSMEGYTSFYNTHKLRKNLLWVGANDGMLHAFDAAQGDELFAYVPGALANRLAEIPLQRTTDSITLLNGQSFVTGAQVQPSGSVWAYVDGNPYTADVKIGNNWKTYLIGSLGRGGRGIFALDVTDVNKLKEIYASDVFKWQFTAKDDSDFSYQVGDVLIHNSSNQASPVARLNNGKFALILGNGPKSLNGKAALFIIYLDGSTAGSWTGKYKKIVLDNTGNNGLSSPRWEDVDGDGTADVVYAGDLKGNLWKIDISNTDAAQWKPAFSAEAAENSTATPLFKASYRVTQSNVTTTYDLPITTAPQLVFMGQGGIMVNFATGNALENGDFGVQSFKHAMFGIWDRGSALSSPRIITRTALRHSNGNVTVSGNTINWENYDGWSLYMPDSGEAILSAPLYDAGVLIFVSTRPKTTTNECSQMPNNAMYAVDPVGGLPSRNTLGTMTVNGTVLNIAAMSIADPKLAGPYKNNTSPPKVGCTAGEPGCVCEGNECSKQTPVCGPGQRSVNVIGRTTNVPICYSNAPRLQWREIPGLRTFQ